MYQYCVNFTFQNRSFTEVIGANSSGDAIFAVKSRYPSALIFGANRV